MSLTHTGPRLPRTTFRIPRILELNPYFALHLQTERAANSGIAWDRWAPILCGMYQGYERPLPCPCGGKLWFRPTVPCRSCPDCSGSTNTVGGQYRVRHPR